jgi:nucleoside-diphosphate-sugar epimerase
MSTHLVTGGAGVIGSALVRRLVAEGHDVRVLDRFSRGKAERLPDEVTCIKGDMCSRSSVMQAVWGVDVVWHLAYVQGTATFYSDPKDVITVALKGIMNVLESCEVQGKPPEFFLMSSSEAYQIPPEGMFPTDETVPLSVPDVTNPRYSYGGGKIASEIATLAYAQAGALGRTAIVRAHNVYGPDMGHDHVIPQFAERMLNIPLGSESHPFTIQGSGTETRSFCYIDDCIDGLMVLLEKGKDRNVYHLGNPYEEHTILDLAHRVASIYSRDIRVVTGDLPKGSPTRRKPSIVKLSALGYEPKVSLDEGLESTLAWYQRDAEEPLEAA